MLELATFDLRGLSRPATLPVFSLVKTANKFVPGANNLVVGKNCGTGAGGFKAGNSCAKGGGVSIAGKSADAKQVVADYVADAISRDVPVDVPIVVDSKLSNRAGRFLYDGNKIELTEHYLNHYRNEKARSTEVPGWTSVSRFDSPSSLLIHELGHAAHASALKASVGAESARQLFVDWSRLVKGGGVPTVDGSKVGTTGFKKVASTVSGYAAANPLEFVAEVYTGRKFGKEYSSIVNSLYSSLGGP